MLSIFYFLYKTKHTFWENIIKHSYLIQLQIRYYSIVNSIFPASMQMMWRRGSLEDSKKPFQRDGFIKSLVYLHENADQIYLHLFRCTDRWYWLFYVFKFGSPNRMVWSSSLPFQEFFGFFIQINFHLT